MIPVTTTVSLRNIEAELSIGEANHLQFDRGTHTVRIEAEETTERILVDVSQSAIQDLLRTRVIRKIRIDFEFEE